MISRITPSDIVNGGVICPNAQPVEVTCVGIEVTVLQWQRNGSSISGGFTGLSNNGEIKQIGPFTLILDSIIRRNIVLNMTSRLTANVSNLTSGDRIGCATVGMRDARTLNYILRGII